MAENPSVEAVYDTSNRYQSCGLCISSMALAAIRRVLLSAENTGQLWPGY